MDDDRRDEAALIELIEQGTICGTQRGRVLQKVVRVDELVGVVAELRKELREERKRRDVEVATLEGARNEEATKFKVELKAERAKRETVREKKDSKIKNLESKKERLEASVLELRARVKVFEDEDNAKVKAEADKKQKKLDRSDALDELFR